MAFKMRGMSFVQGQSPMKKIGGKNYEKSKGDQQGPIPKNNIKLQPSENPDTYAYKEGDINPYYLKDKTKFVEGQRINDLEDRKSFIEEDEFNSGESTKQQTKDKKTLEREAEIMRDRRKNTPAKKHVKGMKHKSKEQLLKEGFTPADADRMIKDGATTGRKQKSIPKPSAKPITIKAETTGKMQAVKQSTKSAHGQMNDAKEEYKQDKKILKKQAKAKTSARKRAKDLKPKNQGKFKPAYEGADYSKKDIAKMSKKEKIAKIDGYTSKKTKK
jgi:hypothetical protein